MSKTALVTVLKKHDLEEVRAILQKRPELKELRLDKGVNLLQFSCGRFTGDDPVAARRQLRLAKWLVRQGFDPRENYTTAPGEDGEADSARHLMMLTPGLSARPCQKSRRYRAASTWRT